jgi:hypothetical protein
MPLKVKSISDIAKAFSVDGRLVDNAVRFAKCEGLTEEEICMAVNKNAKSLRLCPNDFTNSMIYVCRVFSKSLERFKDENMVSGNSIRDRLLEVGDYNPNSPWYIDKTLKASRRV